MDQDTEVKLTPDLAELGELCGCTEMQVRFADGLLQGMSKVEAAAHAGYSGARDSVQLRSAGSSAARSKPVQALLALAESRGLGVPDSPGDAAELKRILWSHARSRDKANSIRASIELDRMIAAERQIAQAVQSPTDHLKKMSGPVAAACAKSAGINYELSPTQEGEYDAYLREIVPGWIEKSRDNAVLAKGIADRVLGNIRLVFNNGAAT